MLKCWPQALAGRNSTCVDLFRVRVPACMSTRPSRARRRGGKIGGRVLLVVLLIVLTYLLTY